VGESGSDIALAARECAVAKQAVALARWIGDGRRPVTSRQVLRKSDVAPAAAAVGMAAPELLRTAADVPALHRPWCLALAAGLLQVADGSVSAGPAVWPAADAEVLSAWLAGLRAACAAEVGPKADEYSAIARALAVLSVLERDRVPAGDALWHAAEDEAAELSAEFDLDWTFALAGAGQLAGVVVLLRAFGAVADGPAITALGRWAVRALRAALPGLDDDLTAAEMIAGLVKFDEAERRDLAWEWMAERDPQEAAREILQAAASKSRLLRWVAADVTELLGEDALPVWQEMLDEPLLAVHARCALHAWEKGPELTEAEWLWLAAESAAAGLEERGPDEALCRICERVPGAGLDDRLASVRVTGHPSAGSLAQAVADFAASGAALTVNQGIQLILLGWDGDYLHAFTVGHRKYSDPFFGLEETGDEDELRVRDAFAASRKIGYEYDFGASWIHEITLQKTVPLDPDTTYPVCVSFVGESPREYESPDDFEDTDEREPFTLAAVNQKLASLGGRLPRRGGSTVTAACLTREGSSSDPDAQVASISAVLDRLRATTGERLRHHRRGGAERSSP
jgi:hypothetical protein